MRMEFYTPGNRREILAHRGVVEMLFQGTKDLPTLLAHLQNPYIREVTYSYGGRVIRVPSHRLRSKRQRLLFIFKTLFWGLVKKDPFRGVLVSICLAGGMGL